MRSALYDCALTVVGNLSLRTVITPVNPYWSQERTHEGFLYNKLHLMVILIILQGTCCPWNPSRNTRISEFTAYSFSPEALICNSVSNTDHHFIQMLLLWSEMTDIIGLAPNRKTRAFPAHPGICLCCWFSIHRWDTSSCHGHPVLRDWVMLQLFLPVHLVRHLGVGLVGQRSNVWLKTSAEGFPSLQYHREWLVLHPCHHLVLSDFKPF